MKYTWVTAPPISEMSPEDFFLYLKKFQTSISSPSIDKILNAMEEIYIEEDCRLYVYLVDDFPVGLLIMSGGMLVKIDEMVGHPSAEGAGSILTEFAVNSVRNGCLSLDSLNEQSTGFWTAMGFVKNGDLHVHGEVGSCKMKLNPAQSNKWQSVSGKWRLNKYLNAPMYLTTIED